MKYEDILGLNDNFHPVYDLKDEIKMYWKRFVPNEKFYDLLTAVLNSLVSNKTNKRKPVWLQGTYGTGKSHATSVIKHLLYDNVNDISDFKIDNQQIKFKLESFRKEKKVFPVVLKGTSGINDNKTFALAIEKAVKEALDKEDIKIRTKTDFEKIISKLKSEKNVINWDHIIEGTELEFFGTKEQIISRLEEGDMTLLTKIERILAEKEDLHFSNIIIADWLVEVKEELQEQGKADYLMIYWDEFTGILDLPNRLLILGELQNIAELSTNKGVKLFIVAHRRPHQIDATQEELKKFFGRVEVVDYSMESITTYQIINASINKINKIKWLEIKNQHIDKVKFIIDEISGTANITVQRSLENLFPIHPYTSYLATFMARNIGSTERSIFNFLYDDKNGFKSFIKGCPVGENNIFLTADYLWDFFYDEFDRMDNEKIHSVLEKFKLHKDFLEKQDNNYLSVFKGILLLNILYKEVVKISETSFVTPSTNNIKDIFAGSIEENALNEILNFIDNKQIINKTPDDLYLLTSSGLPPRDVEIEKTKLINQNLRIDEILDNKQQEEIKFLIKSNANRSIEILLIDSNLSQPQIRNKIEKAFKKEYTIRTCLFLSKSSQEIHLLKTTLNDLSKDPNLKNIVFAVSEIPLEEKNFERYLEYRARAIVADKRRYSEDKKENEDFSKKIIDKWIKNIKSGYIAWFLDNETDGELMREFTDKINKELSKKVFPFGLENIDGTLKNHNIWTYKRAKASADIFLLADKLDHVLEDTRKGPERYLREIIRDNTGEYIVDSNLNLKEDISDNHPIIAMHNLIHKKFEEGKNKGTFNMGKDLSSLAKSPYGLYPNMVNMAAIGFLLREYAGKLFEAGIGTPINKQMMRKKPSQLVDFWKDGTGLSKLEVRFGSEDEKKLINILSQIFNLKDINNLNSARWGVRKWVKQVGFPIWVFKYADINEKTGIALDSIFKLIESIDKELNREVISKCLDNIEIVEYDLEVLIETEDPEQLFKKWLGTIKNIEISSEDFKDVIQYIKKNMQEEVASWSEIDTRDKVKDWKLEKISDSDQKDKQTEPSNQSTKQPSGEEESNTQSKPTGQFAKESSVRKDITTQSKPTDQSKSEDSTTSSTSETIGTGKGEKPPEIKDDLKEIVAKIEHCNENILKKVIISVIKERPDIIGIIEKFLGN